MKQRGQSLVELALTLPILLFVLVASTDVFTAAANALIAKSISARGARGAALSTYPDGVTSCMERVTGLVEGNVFYLAEYTWAATNCPVDRNQAIAQGSEVSVTLFLNYHPTFLWGDPWTIEVGTIDYGR